MGQTAANNVTTTITQLQRTGSGDVSETLVSFQWSGVTHSGSMEKLKFKLGTKLVRKVLPGSNQVVHQAMSAAWDPFQISGEWNDVWMGNGLAWATYQEFGNFCQQIPLARVVIDGLSFTGMISDLEIEYHNINKIGWSFTISPETNDNISEIPTFGTGSTVQTQSIPQWLNDATTNSSNLQTTLANAASIPLSTNDWQNTSDALEEISDAIDQIQELTTLAGAVIDVSQDLVTSTINTGLDVTDLVWTLPAKYVRLANASLSVAAAMATLRADLAVAYDDFIQELAYTQFVHQTTISAWQTFMTAIDAEKDMKSRNSQRPRAIYTPKPGESLERISQKYYGTPDNASLIYQKNSLTSIVLTGAEELIIPEVGA